MRRPSASMRPPEFTGGNHLQPALCAGDGHTASMRPPEFTGGNTVGHETARPASGSFNEAAGIHRRKPRNRNRHTDTTMPASMRPPEFTGGNLGQHRPPRARPTVASMRPPEFTGGNPARRGAASLRHHPASMRPPEFTGGNGRANAAESRQLRCFNEAAGIHRRKPAPADCRRASATGFNEAAGIHRRKLALPFREHAHHLDASMRPPEFTGGNIRGRVFIARCSTGLQ